MKKIVLFILFSFYFITGVSCKNRTLNEATQLVSQFVNQSVNGVNKTSNIKSSALTLSYTSINKDDPSLEKVFYYVFNKGNNNGYVIISGDDRTKIILGYSDEGYFDISVLPINLKDWLNFYENEIKSLPDISLNSTISAVSTSSKVNSSSIDIIKPIAPLLGNIKWNQNYPYNSQCPFINEETEERAASGCVATGMAQVMKYYNWPIHGTGENTYTISSREISKSVDLSKTQYDWSNMTDTYSNTSTDIQNKAVATLIYHCGVAVNMDYGKSSSASTINMGLALINNFGYDSNLQLYIRDYYTRSEWISLLNTELISSKPVLFSGNSENSGHLFVCDGYDNNGLYHFNWGWGGKSNGYFEISALDTDSPGIGSSSLGYNNYQTIIVGLQKPTTNSTPTYLIYTTQPLTSSTISVTRNGSFTITGNGIFNFGMNTFSGDIGLGLYNDKGFVQSIKLNTVNLLESNYGWSDFPVSTTIPSGIANGNYKIYFIYKASNEKDFQIMRGKTGTANYLNIALTGSLVTINEPTNSGPLLSLNSINLNGNLYHNKTGRFSVSVTNNGNEYNSKLGVNLKSTSNDSKYQLVNTETVNIAAGETRTLDFTGKINMDPGEYNISVLYDSLNSSSPDLTFSQLGISLKANVLTAPTEESTLTMSSIISFPNSISVDKNNVFFSAKIKNSTGLFDNKLIAFVFPQSGGKSLANLGYQSAIFDTNEEKNVTFNGSLDLSPGVYQIGVYYLDSNDSWINISPSNYSLIPFTLFDNLTTDTKQVINNGFEFYPNPVIRILNLKTDQSIKRIVITDMFGKQLKSFIPELSDKISFAVDYLKSGTYLMKVQTVNGMNICKFIKK